MAVKTSLVISFKGDSAAENAVLTAELDTRDDGLNVGRNTFVYGDEPAYLIFKTPNVTFTQESTDGSLVYVETGLMEVDETISFVGSSESSLQKPPYGDVNWTFIAGRDIDVDDLIVTGTKVTSPTEGLAVVRAQYASQYIAYRLAGIADPMIEGLDSYEVIVYILGEVG